MEIAVFWFKRDLRLEDNIGLWHALNDKYPVLPIFIFDKNILNDLEEDDPRIGFIHQRLMQLNIVLKKYHSSILCLQGKPSDVWESIFATYNVKSIYANKDYEPYAQERDKHVTSLAAKFNAGFHQYKDQVIFHENDILKKDEKPYSVFSAYKRKWLLNFDFTKHTKKHKLDFSKLIHKKISMPSLSDIGFSKSEIQVKPFVLENVENYHRYRDYPKKDMGTYLSVHLRFGTLSIRELLHKTYYKSEVFVSELIWREFFMQILYHYPKVVTHNFKPKFDYIKWRNNIAEFNLWCAGKTGYPIVDAGMRQLNKTGYMHNRVRMITASFLVKHLLIDWRWGEAFFAKKLLDYELASNNGNWQWAASTGCDAVPYFRVFNPTLQQQKFDKDFEYIQKWIPEINKPNYPKPIIDHKIARERYLSMFNKK